MSYPFLQVRPQKDKRTSYQAPPVLAGTLGRH